MHTFFYLGIAMVAGLVLSRVVKKLRLPNVTGYLIAGLLIGPCVLGLVPQAALDKLNIITTIALGFIAFSIGNEFRLSQLKKTGKQAMVIGVLQALAALAFVDIALVIFHFLRPDVLSVPAAITLGAIATATAPATTLMVVRQYKAKGELTNTLLPVVAMDDAVGLIVFAVSSAIADTLASGVQPSVYTMAVAPLIEIALSLLSGGLLGFLISLSMRFFHSRANKMCICIAGVVLGVAIAQQFGLSDLLVCMSVGAVFANLRNDALEVMDVCDGWTPPLFMLFFVISGAELDVGALPTVGLLGVLYIVVRSFGKYFGAYLGSVVVKASPNIRKYLGITLLPQAGVAIGMAQRVLTQLPQFGARIQAVVLSATLIYELVGPVATKIALTKAGEIQGAK